MRKGNEIMKMIKKMKGEKMQKEEKVKLYGEEGEEVRYEEKIRGFWQRIYQMHGNDRERMRGGRRRGGKNKEERRGLYRNVATESRRSILEHKDYDV